MKKTLIALAAMAATGAFAQNVTISGTFDATYRTATTETAAGVETKSSRLGKDGIGTTGFTLSGNEDLGGGLKAVFLVENNFDVSNTGTEGTTSTATGQRFSQGQIFVGLEGSFGSVKVGAPNTPSLTVQGLRAGSFGTKDGGRAAIGASGYSTLMGVALTRFDSTFNYTSPNFSGFSFGATYKPKSDNAATPGEGALSDIGVFYNNGPISAGVSVFSLDPSSGTGVNGIAANAAKVEQTTYAVTYNFGFAKFGLGGHEYKTGTTKNSGLNALAEVPLSSALAATVNYQQLNDKSAPAVATAVDVNQLAVGLQYSLSKRTLAYTRYITASADDATGTNVKDASRFLVGLRHNF